MRSSICQIEIPFTTKIRHQVVGNFNHKDWTNDPNTVMIRELKGFFDDAETKEEKRRPRQRITDNYRYYVYRHFLDMREEKMINFSLKRWRVSELHGNISKVKLDSLNSGNKIYRTE